MISLRFGCFKSKTNMNVRMKCDQQYFFLLFCHWPLEHCLQNVTLFSILSGVYFNVWFYIIGTIQ